MSVQLSNVLKSPKERPILQMGLETPGVIQNSNVGQVDGAS